MIDKHVWLLTWFSFYFDIDRDKHDKGGLICYLFIFLHPWANEAIVSTPLTPDDVDGWLSMSKVFFFNVVVMIKTSKNKFLLLHKK